MARLFALCGPSGCGKTTVARCVAMKNPGVMLMKSMTTRKPRGEDDFEYEFVDHSKMDSYSKAGLLLERTDYAGHEYALPHLQVKYALEAKLKPLAILTGPGIMQASRTMEVVGIFVLPERFSDLENRMRGRGDGDESVGTRMRVALADLAYAADLPHYVINSNLMECVDEVSAIIDSYIE